MRKFFISSLSGFALSLSMASIAMAAAPSADVGVQLQGPSTSAISTPTTYTATVKNFGPATANNINLVLEFPLTNTSPTVHILGTVTESDTRCSITANTITCTLGSLKKNKTTTVSYSYTAPVATKSLEMKAIVSSSVSDTNTGNNTATFTPVLTYPTRALTSANVLNSHCTGTNLTSYFECALYPSSISSHVTTLNADLSIGFSEPGYTGNWSQNPAKTTLFFEYFENGSKIAEFNGFAVNGSNCFNGMTTFFPLSTYNSPYNVCIQ